MHVYGLISTCKHVSRAECSVCEPVVKLAGFPNHYADYLLSFLLCWAPIRCSCALLTYAGRAKLVVTHMETFDSMLLSLSPLLAIAVARKGSCGKVLCVCPSTSAPPQNPD
ncbi:ataxin-7-like protein 1 isoform X1 [Tachysurus ichikawai]